MSFQKTGFIHAVPWLMLATAMRIIYATSQGLVEHVTFTIANLAILLAFLIVAHHLIVLTGGRTELGTLGFARQIGIARPIVLRISLLLSGLAIAAVFFGAPGLAGQFLSVFDGIAFDQFSRVGALYSSVAAAAVLMMALAAESGRPATIAGALIELARRWKSMLPAIIAVTAFLVLLSSVQGDVRRVVQELWETSWVPLALRAYVYFAFIFSFATLRLCGSLAVLVLALRRSYRARAGAPVPPPPAIAGD